MAKWAEINDRIRECRSRPDAEACLRRLYEETRDGMVAFALGEELERGLRLDEASDFFAQAERLFPKPEYKARAKAAIERVKGPRPASAEPVRGTMDPKEGSGTLYVISCTKRKIWDDQLNAPKYVPARDAYVGEWMRRWLDSGAWLTAEHWVILSARYGFIEPDQPISRYDVTFSDDRTGPISLDSLRAQIECQDFGGQRLKDFGSVEVWGSVAYFRIVCAAFSRSPAQVVRKITGEVPDAS